jgi:hypothetical protein
MQRLPVSEAQWIKQLVIPYPGGDFKEVGNTVERVIPPCYEGYAKLFHPFEIDTKERDALEPNRNQNRSTHFTINVNNNEGIVLIETNDEGTKSISYDEYVKRIKQYALLNHVYTNWRAVAEKYGLSFHQEISPLSFSAHFKEIGWPRNLIFPKEGYLARPLLIQLLSLLKHFTVDENMFIYQLVPNSIMKDGRTEDLVKCSLEEVTEYFPEDFIGYMYAADRSWMVYTNTDLYFTLVGGSNVLIQTLANSNLEVLPCLPTTRIDDYSDRINKAPE